MNNTAAYQQRHFLTLIGVGGRGDSPPLWFFLDKFLATNVDGLKLGDFSYNSILHIIATFF